MERHCPWLRRCGLTPCCGKVLRSTGGAHRLLPLVIFLGGVVARICTLRPGASRRRRVRTTRGSRPCARRTRGFPNETRTAAPEALHRPRPSRGRAARFECLRCLARSDASAACCWSVVAVVRGLRLDHLDELLVRQIIAAAGYAGYGDFCAVREPDGAHPERCRAVGGPAGGVAMSWHALLPSLVRRGGCDGSRSASRVRWSRGVPR
jgi:hypothetical protein